MTDKQRATTKNTGWKFKDGDSFSSKRFKKRCKSLGKQKYDWMGHYMRVRNIKEILIKFQANWILLVMKKKKKTFNWMTRKKSWQLKSLWTIFEHGNTHRVYTKCS